MTDQMSLFEHAPTPTRAKSPQQENLDRVSDRIGAVVVAFFQARDLDSEFHADDLRRWVNQWFPNCAPDSAGRIMRMLRDEGSIGYAVVNRRQSLYRITACK